MPPLYLLKRFFYHFLIDFSGHLLHFCFLSGKNKVQYNRNLLLTRFAGSEKYSLDKGSKLSTVALGSKSPGTLLSVELCDGKEIRPVVDYTNFCVPEIKTFLN